MIWLLALLPLIYFMMASIKKPASDALPALFFSHGGPNFMHRADSGVPQVYDFLKRWGTQIKNEWNPEYIVVVSAHWQSFGPNESNVAVGAKNNTQNELIYDFGNFPPHYYKEQFRSKYSHEVASKVRNALEKGGLQSNLVKRGIDHGVWVPFKVAFSDYTIIDQLPKTSDIVDLENTPVVQVSLTLNEDDFDANFKIGRALNTLRAENPRALIVLSGMSVHNLPDLFRGRPTPYSAEFNQKIRDVIAKSTGGVELLQELKKIHQLPIFRQAHPSSEHFAPFVVAAGLLLENKKAKELFNAEQRSVGWGFYTFD